MPLSSAPNGGRRERRTLANAGVGVAGGLCSCRDASTFLFFRRRVRGPEIKVPASRSVGTVNSYLRGGGAPIGFDREWRRGVAVTVKRKQNGMPAGKYLFTGEQFLATRLHIRCAPPPKRRAVFVPCANLSFRWERHNDSRLAYINGITPFSHLRYRKIQAAKSRKIIRNAVTRERRE